MAQRPDPLRVGFIGLGDQGLPMATAIAEAGFDLHVWARRTSSLDGLAGVPHTAHVAVAELAGAVDIVALCVSTDDDVLHLTVEELLPSLRTGAVLVNHGTGTPANARRLAEACATRGVEVLDAPVSGGRPAAEARTLTTLVGGPEMVLTRCEPVFRSFARHVVYLGAAGSGQMAKLFNNALLMLNQAAIADILALAADAALDVPRLVEALKLGSAASTALGLMNTMVNPDTVDHLSKVEALDMELFAEAMRNAGVNATEATDRGLSGARRLPEVIARLNP
ncbi:NAD(P)-dependent oxidoreductase [Streptomyces sp. NPDC101152]|uniref:NAD(P)-dependent oxidoreductase n=1 Tax=Streptomyces sp. NPDC101152 TaxID=3366116 RepID=UPI003816AF5A